MISLCKLLLLGSHWVLKGISLAYPTLFIHWALQLRRVTLRAGISSVHQLQHPAVHGQLFSGSFIGGASRMDVAVAVSGGLLHQCASVPVWAFIPFKRGQTSSSKSLHSSVTACAQ